MKLAFSTLGSPEWNIDTTISKAREYGFDAVEIRGLKGEFHIQSLPEFSTNAKETSKKFKNNNLTIPCFASTTFLFKPLLSNKKTQQQNIKEITEYSKLCYTFDSKYIRVFGGRIGDQNRDDAVKEAISTLTIWEK